MNTFDEVIEQARKWPRDDYGEGYWFNAMADKMELLRAAADAMRDAFVSYLGDSGASTRSHPYQYEKIEAYEMVSRSPERDAKVAAEIARLRAVMMRSVRNR